MKKELRKKYKAKAKALFELVQLHGIEDDPGSQAFHELQLQVEEEKQNEAKRVGNKGIEAQIAYLLGSYGSHPEREKNALDMVVDILKLNCKTGMVECLACEEPSFEEYCEKYLDGWRCADCKAAGRVPKAVTGKPTGA